MERGRSRGGEGAAPMGEFAAASALASPGEILGTHLLFISIFLISTQKNMPQEKYSTLAC